MAAVFAHEFTHLVKGLEGNGLNNFRSQSDPHRDVVFGQRVSDTLVLIRDAGMFHTNLEEDRAMGIGPFFTSTSANSFRLRIGLEPQLTHWILGDDLRFQRPKVEMKTVPLFGH